MDFIDQLKQLGRRAEQLVDLLSTEEATKQSLILPFFTILGYDVFNPTEFIPEFTADVGIKKGEKVDYAVLINGEPEILVEAKSCKEKLENHDSQLFRYFGTTKAKFAVLTNGIVYRFFTDLEEPNKMDLTPFMEINMFDIKDVLVPELKKFCKGAFDPDAIYDTASDLKYTNLIKQYLAKQASSPDDAFVYLVVSEVRPGGRKTQQIIDRFRDITRKSFTQYIGDVINDKLKTVMKETKEDEQSSTVSQAPSEQETKPVGKSLDTTETELEAYAIIKTILRDSVETNQIMYKDTSNYFTIRFAENERKWICRLYLNGSKWNIVLVRDNKEVRLPLNTLDTLYELKEDIIASALRLVEKKDNDSESSK